MKKRLFLLPLVGGFLLSGCTVNLFGKTFTVKLPWEKEEQQEQKEDDKPSGSDSDKPSGGDSGSGGSGGGTSEGFVFPTADSSVFININHDDFDNIFEENYTYPQEAYEFTSDGVSFSATSGVGHKTKQSTGGNFYNDNKVLQFRKHGDSKPAGEITVKSAVSATKITIHWLATYQSEAATYFPVVLVGDSASDISTNVAAKESAPATGVSVGAKEGNYDAYFFTTTYDISGHSYFTITSQNNAMYVKDIWVHH